MPNDKKVIIKHLSAAASAIRPGHRHDHHYSYSVTVIIVKTTSVPPS